MVGKKSEKILFTETYRMGVICKNFCNLKTVRKRASLSRKIMLHMFDHIPVGNNRRQLMVMMMMVIIIII